MSGGEAAPRKRPLHLFSFLGWGPKGPCRAGLQPVLRQPSSQRLPVVRLRPEAEAWCLDSGTSSFPSSS